MKSHLKFLFAIIAIAQAFLASNLSAKENHTERNCILTCSDCDGRK